MATRLKRHGGNPGKPRENLHHYEDFLSRCVRLGTRWGELSDERLDHLLWLRSELKLSLERYPDGLAPEERQQLRQLDKQLRALAPLIKRGEPNLHRWAKQLGYPRSHWWWYLTERTDKRRKASKTHRKE